MRIVYNSPVILTFTLAAAAVLVLDYLAGGWIIPAFFTTGNLETRLIGAVSHILGHVSWRHYYGNFIMILLIGPLLEEKYGSGKMTMMILVTAILTAGVNYLFFLAPALAPFGKNNLLGASGIVYMMFILGSFTNVRSGEIPATFILAFLIYIGAEVINSFTPDSVSQLGHILGGVSGGVFGLLLSQKAGATSIRRTA